MFMLLFASGSCDPASCECECEYEHEHECEVEDDSPMLSFDSRSIEVIEVEADIELGSCLQSLLDGLGLTRRCREGLR